MLTLASDSTPPRFLSCPKENEEATRPYMPTTVPKYHSGLGWAVHTAKGPEMSYAVTDNSFGAAGASSCLIWVDPRLQLIRICLTHYFGNGEFRTATLL